MWTKKKCHAFITHFFRAPRLTGFFRSTLNPERAGRFFPARTPPGVRATTNPPLRSAGDDNEIILQFRSAASGVRPRFYFSLFSRYPGHCPIPALALSLHSVPIHSFDQLFLYRFFFSFFVYRRFRLTGFSPRIGKTEGRLSFTYPKTCSFFSVSSWRAVCSAKSVDYNRPPVWSGWRVSSLAFDVEIIRTTDGSSYNT